MHFLFVQLCARHVDNLDPHSAWLGNVDLMPDVYGLSILVHLLVCARSSKRFRSATVPGDVFLRIWRHAFGELGSDSPKHLRTDADVWLCRAVMLCAVRRDAGWSLVPYPGMGGTLGLTSSIPFMPVDPCDSVSGILAFSVSRRQPLTGAVVKALERLDFEAEALGPEVCSVLIGAVPSAEECKQLLGFQGDPASLRTIERVVLPLARIERPAVGKHLKRRREIWMPRQFRHI